MRKRRTLSFLPMTFCLMTFAGCGVGPQVKTEYVIARPGAPGMVLENRPVKLLPANASEPVMQDLGGGVWMPQEHFDALMRAVNKAEKPNP